MAVLQPNEYDISYFDGNSTSLRHNAGFSSYTRWPRSEGENSQGEYWKDIAYKLLTGQAFQNKKILELACAKGFVVKDLRDMGVNAWGMDVSPYAISQCEEGMAPYLKVDDVRTDLSQYANKEWDVVYSIRLWECVDDADIANLITQITRIAKKQVHIITTGTDLNTVYYNFKPLQQWLTYGWPKGTVLLPYLDFSQILIK